MKIVVIGLDGAGFELIQPWLDEGKLPNLKMMIDEGCSADLESCLPPVTSPNWKCYSTGKNPGKLGIFWWENVDLRNRRVAFPYARINESKEIWDYMSKKGNRVGIINMPLTHPPKKVNGFMISDRLGMKGDFTYPKELKYRLKKEFDFIDYPKSIFFIKEKSEEVAKEIFEIINNRFDIGRTMLKEYELDFLHVTIFHINTLQHDFWNEKFTEDAWKLIDKNIGLLLEEDRNIFIMSDHGSNPIKQVFYINSWLVKENYLKLNTTAKFSGLLYKLGLHKQRLMGIAKLLGLIPLLRRVIPMEILDFFPSEAGTVDHSGKTDKIDWDKTKAIGSGHGLIYINLDGKEREKLREELLIKLEYLRNPGSGEKIAQKVYRKEEIYRGKYLSEAPDLIFDQTHGTHTRGGIDISGKRVFEKPQRWKAENKREGLFVAYGPDIKRGEKLKDISILDLAPTILHLMNIPVSEDMDGRVLTEIFEDDSEPAKRRIKYQKVEDYKTQREKERIKQSIKNIR